MQHAGDAELLNAIFRGFHTIKGGAGFLEIDPLVETCHCAEDVFNSLLQGKRKLTLDLIDAILQALDKINAMMLALRVGEAVDDVRRFGQVGAVLPGRLGGLGALGIEEIIEAQNAAIAAATS